MTELTIKSDRAALVKSELEAALRGQRRMLQDSIERTKINLAAFEAKYGFNTDELRRRATQPIFDDTDLDLIEWLGECTLLERLESELDILDEIRIGM